MSKQLNNLQRVDPRIEKEYKEVYDYRDVNKKSKITFRRFTELICQHLKFSEIKGDIALKDEE